MSGPKHADRLQALRRFNPYPAYKNSGVEWLGEIPAHWEVKRLKRIGALQAGSAITSESIEPTGDYPVFGGNGIRGFTDSFTHDGEFPLIGRQGALCGCVSLASGQFWASEHAVVVRPAESVNSKWLADLLAAMSLNSYSQSAAQPGLAIDTIGVIRAPSPPPTEQRAIADFLDRETVRIDALVAKKERLIELLQEQRTALITRAVTKGLDVNVQLSHTSSAVFPQVPSGWDLRKLRRVITRIRRPVKVDPDSDYREIGIRSWGKGIFHKEALRGALLEEKSVFGIEPGDFVLNIVFAWEGAVAVATEQETGMVGSHRFPTFRCSEEVERDYLLMVLQTDQGRALMEVNSPGAAGRNRTIRLDQFLDELIPLPLHSEQREIIRQFRSDEVKLSALVGRLRDAIERLKELRTALISAAVTGKIDVRDAVSH